MMERRTTRDNFGTITYKNESLSRVEGIERNGAESNKA